MTERETWATRVGFILAAVGSAVGLGNIWQFPFQTATNGGSAFLVVYLLAVIAIGFPAMLSEFVIGRRSKRNPINAFERLNFDSWRWVGVLGLATGFWILSFYSVVGGWVLRYILASATGAYFGDPATFFTSIAAGTDAVLFHAVFMTLTVGIVALGIKDGIELGTKVMVPSIILLLLGLAVWASTLPGSGPAYGFFLDFQPAELAANATTIIPAAVGQAFFTLSLGMGAMITYASYLGEDDNLGTDGLSIVVLNTGVGVLAGLVVFPLLFAQGVSPDTSGAGAVFISVASAFATLPLGRVLGAVFFLIVALAALSSAISLLEVVVSYLIDNYGVDRKVSAGAIGVVLFVLGLPTAMSTSTLGFYNDLAYNILLPVVVLLTLVFVGWVLADDALDELRQGTTGLGGLGTLWLWMVRTVIVLAVGFTLALGIQDFLVNHTPILSEAVFTL